MREPRKPSPDEKYALVTYVLQRMHEGWSVEEYAIVQGWVEDAYIAVFDSYVSESPGYTGKIMTVIWAAGPNLYEVFLWRDGNIQAIPQTM